MRTVIALGLLLGACGGSSEPAPARAPAPPESAANEPASPAAPRRVESLDRREVVATVNAGLGRFLQRVEVEPELVDGQFKGFRIVGLYPAEWWSGVDLAPGDVVTQVNGMPIERDTQAYAAFETLRSAKELRVSLVRQGQPRDLVLPIIESGDGKGSPSPSAPPGKASAPPAGSAKPSGATPAP